MLVIVGEGLAPPVRVPVRTWSRTGLPPRTRLPPRTPPTMDQERRNTGIALLRSNKLMQTTNKRQILLAT